MAGAPKGNHNAAKGFKARQALEKAVFRLSNPDTNHPRCVQGFEVLVQMWMKTINDYMEEGNVQGLNAVMDRLDGKPGQSLIIDADVNLKKADELTDEELANIASSSS